MKISLRWLNEFVALPCDLQSREALTGLAHDLTMAGVAVENVAGDGGDAVLETDITTNRVDAMNHYGIARECAAIYDLDLPALAPSLPAAQGAHDVAIEITDAAGCARYTARVIRNLTIQASSPEIQRRLQLLGHKSINSAADASNYTLLEMGHPTHAFDLDRLQGGKIVVRRARPGETLKTLDGIDRKLDPEDLVIADAAKPVAIAGVMGGFDSMITSATRNVLIESAWFDPVTVRRTSRRLGMHTDASHRFERGADWGTCPVACDRVAELLLTSGAGELCGSAIDSIARPIDRPTLRLPASEVLRILGLDIPRADIRRILTRLQFGFAQEGDTYVVTVPTWRLDVESNIDLIEEIARIYGYNRFPSTLPTFSGAVNPAPDANQAAKIRATLLALGYNEAISLTFISNADAAAFSRVAAAQVANPINEETPAMRTSLLPGILDMMAWNLNRGVSEARLFECGQIYSSAGPETSEQPAACLAQTWDALLASRDSSERISPADANAATIAFRRFKGDIETLLERFEHATLVYDAAVERAYYHPGRSARAVFNSVTVARFGELHPRLQEERKLKQPVYIAELDLAALYKVAPHQPHYGPISRYPAVERDFSFFFPAEITFQKIRNAAEALGIEHMRSFDLGEIYRGKNIPAGQYSALLRARFQSDQRTLLDDEVKDWSAKITTALQGLGGQQRV